MSPARRALVALLAAAPLSAALADEPAAGQSAPDDAAARKDGAVGEARAAPAGPTALEKLLKSIKADGALKLPEGAAAELAALMPGSRKGEECAEGAQVLPDATALKDRGDGALLVAQVSTCKGAVVMAFSPGLPTRAARLLDLAEGEGLSSAHAINLSGKKREEDLALELSVQPHKIDLHALVRREAAFAFSEVGVNREFGAQGDCSAGGEVAAGFTSYLKIDAKGRLQILRVDLSCGPGPWAARCEGWALERGSLEHAAVCPLPPRLDARSLHAAGWK